MTPLLSTLAALCTVAACSHPRPAAPRVGYVTLLGNDTVAAESFVRTGNHLEGDILVRVPGTVHFHYVVDAAGDGSLSRSVLDMHPLGAPNMAERRVTLERVQDSVRIIVDSGGKTRTFTHAVDRAAIPTFMTGFDESFGLYESMGLWDLAMTRVPSSANDTMTVLGISVASGRATLRRFLRRAPTAVDVDYFGMAWNHVTLDSAGQIAAVDARETTEQTRTLRSDGVDVMALAKAFAKRDRDGHSLGSASPTVTMQAKLGGSPIVVVYGSPRRRGRDVLGNVVPYDRVWRTGANAATILSSDKNLVIGGTAVPAGTYTLWTLPTKSGVQLIVNQQKGQWGTDYNARQDLARIPMKATTAASPLENFTIAIDGQGNTGELRIAWDTFVWTVPIEVK